MPAIAVLYVSLWIVFFVRVVVAYAYAKWFGLEVLCVGLAGPGPELLFKRFQYKGHNLIFGGLFVPYIELEHMNPSWNGKKMLKFALLPLVLLLALLLLYLAFARVSNETFGVFGIPLEGYLYVDDIVSLDAGMSFQEIINQLVAEHGIVRGFLDSLTFLFLLHVSVGIADGLVDFVQLLVTALRMRSMATRYKDRFVLAKENISFANGYILYAVVAVVMLVTLTSN